MLGVVGAMGANPHSCVFCNRIKDANRGLVMNTVSPNWPGKSGTALLGIATLEKISFQPKKVCVFAICFIASFSIIP
jgi:hypothetical protein